LCFTTGSIAHRYHHHALLIQLVQISCPIFADVVQCISFSSFVSSFNLFLCSTVCAWECHTSVKPEVSVGCTLWSRLLHEPGLTMHQSSTPNAANSWLEAVDHTPTCKKLARMQSALRLQAVRAYLLAPCLMGHGAAWPEHPAAASAVQSATWAM
jgi:hypothetical protein